MYIIFYDYVYIVVDIFLCGRNLNSDVMDVFIIKSVDLATWKSIKVNVKKYISIA